MLKQLKSYVQIMQKEKGMILGYIKNRGLELSQTQTLKETQVIKVFKRYIQTVTCLLNEQRKTL